MLDHTQLRGAIPAIATPFTADGSTVDVQSLDRLVAHVLSNGCTGVVACGSTGEAATLTDDEYRIAVSTAVAAVRKVPGRFCIAGIGASSTARAVDIARSLGSSVDGILLVAPPYNKPPQEGIIAHFEAVRAAAKVPLIAYNVPGRTAVNITPKTLAILAQKKIIIGVKESSGSIDQVADIAALVGQEIALLSGEDSLALATMVLGGTGIISVTANIAPDKISALVTAALAGRWDDARKLQLETLPLTRALFMETNPIPVKTALALRGIIAHPALRLPLMPAQRETIERLKTLLSL